MTRRQPAAAAGKHRAVHRDPTVSTRWLTIEDFCAEVGVPMSTAYKWAQAGPGSGRFPRFRRLPNGRIRIRRDWLEEWLDALPTH